MRGSKAFTMVELLVVIAILALMVSILLPSLSQSHELARRSRCAANLHGIGQAMYIYAQHDPHVFPAVSAVREADDGAVRVFNSADREPPGMGGPSTTGIPSPTVDLWTLLRRNYTLPKQFICPSTYDTPDPAQDTTAYYDFLTAVNLSYGYQYQHDPNREILGTTSEPTFPLMADANPYVKGKVESSILEDRQSKWRGNSRNHTMREGENILFVDSHVEFELGPDVGLSGKSHVAIPSSRGRDHCYTTFTAPPADTVDPGNSPPQPQPFPLDGSVGTVNLGGRSDACLIP